MDATHERRLEDAVLEALQALSARRPSPLPRCPVCAGPMRRADEPDGASALTCLDCGSVLVDPAPAAESQLRLVS
jgi:hypothetical protein